MIYDAAIIGTGPAGLSAALNLKIHQKNFIWFGSKSLSKKIEKAELVSNYPGLSSITGEGLKKAFKDQIEDMNIEINESMVTSIVPMGDFYAIVAENDFYQVKSLIMATGVAAAGTIVGEEKLLGRGVSYCATCDGALYKGKTIAVVCNNPRFEHEVYFLASLAEKIYYFPQYKGVSEMPENVEIINQRVISVKGEQKVETIELKDGNLEVDGIFCLRDSISMSALLPQITTDKGHILVDREMKTNLDGCFACGDCTGRPYQYAKAVGEGNVAAHSVIEYLSDK